VHWETGVGAFGWIIESKMVKQKKWVEAIARMRRDGAAQAHTRALHDKLGFNAVFYFPLLVHTYKFLSLEYRRRNYYTRCGHKLRFFQVLERATGCYAFVTAGIL